jgi:pSer/pThr/pTyr-binding forkhead associated (FHA) protein
MAYYYLEVTRGQEVGKRFLLSDGAISLGRSSDNVISLDQNERIISSHHAIIYKYPDSITIQDMSSTNGTFKNEKRITQEELSVGDEVGFGEKGPRLKLIISEDELSTKTPTPLQKKTISKTDETEQSFNQKTGLEREEREDSDKLFSKKTSRPSSNDIGSLTMEMENKLRNKKMNSDEMHKLMNQGDRVEKILQKGNLSETQVHFLHTAYGAHRKSRKNSLTAIGIIIGVSMILITFFTVRMFQYRSQVNKAYSLEKQLDGYEEKIAEAKNTGAGTKEITTLIGEFEKTKGQFNSVKMELKEEDFQRIYQDTVEMFINETMSSFGETDYHIPPQMTERVKYHLDVYSGKLKPVIARYLQRKAIYFPMICRIFSEKKVPLELAYVSMLESGFNPKALSIAGARGLWQFMPKTGRNFGLVVDDITDERCDPEKATRSAAEYFKDLIGIFGGQSSVMLAMAAYNAGEGRVMGALRKIDDPMRNRDFWYIYRMGYLAEETNEYIPRVLALMIIDKHPELYGFKISTPSTYENLEAENDFIPQEKKAE